MNCKFSLLLHSTSLLLKTRNQPIDSKVKNDKEVRIWHGMKNSNEQWRREKRKRTEEVNMHEMVTSIRSLLC